MPDARSSYCLFNSKKPFKVIVCLVTLVAFFVNTFSYDLALLRPLDFVEQAWAATDAAGLPSVGPAGAGGPGSPKELRVDTFMLPSHLGTVQFAETSGKDKAGTVIHIQDAHCNYAAQKKISEILGYLNDRYGIRTVNLEGGSKEYDLTVFTRIEDLALRGKVSDRFVNEGTVSGAEYYAINNPDKVDLWGIEDPKLYVRNLNVYRDSLKNKKEVDKDLKALGHILSNLKARMYPKPLLEFDLRYTQYKAGNLQFAEYIRYLVARAKELSIAVRSFKDIYLLSQALETESSIDFRNANNERDALIDLLQKKLSKKSMEELVVNTVEFRAERMSHKQFYSYLAEKTRATGVDIGAYPELQKYIVYISMYEAIDKSRIMAELEILEDGIRASLCVDDDQRELAALSKNLALLRNFFNISLTRSDYAYYKRDADAFAMKRFTDFISRTAPLYKIDARPDKDIADIDTYRRQMAQFYEYSFMRDEVFIKNIRYATSEVDTEPATKKPRRLNARANSATIVITGGFHTENLRDLFREKGISYISILPNFRNGEGYESRYYALLQGKEDPVEKQIIAIMPNALAIASYLNGIGILTRGARAEAAFNIRVRWGAAIAGGKAGVIIKHRINGREVALAIGKDWTIVPENTPGLEAINVTELTTALQLPAAAQVTKQQTRASEIIRSVLANGILSAGELERRGITAMRSPDKKLGLDEGAIAIIEEVMDERSFNDLMSGHPEYSAWYKNISDAERHEEYLSYLSGKARNIVRGDGDDRSPVYISAEREDEVGIESNVKKYGREEVEDRLRSSVLVFMRTKDSIAKLRERAVINVGSGVTALGFESISPELIEAVFVPTGLYESIRSSISPELASRIKIVKVDGEVKSPIADVNIPDWEKAVGGYIASANITGQETFMMHGVRLPTAKEADILAEAEARPLGTGMALTLPFIERLANFLFGWIAWQGMQHVFRQAFIAVIEAPLTLLGNIFVNWHKNITPEQKLQRQKGLLAIYGAMIVASLLASFLYINSDNFGLILTGSIYAANALAHTAYNAVARKFGLAPLTLGVPTKDEKKPQEEADRKKRQRESYEYRRRFISERFPELDKNDVRYAETREIFDHLVSLMKKEGLIASDREIGLVVYNSQEFDASYWPGGDTVFMSAGFFRELDAYLKKSGRAGISKDHVAAVLGHELRHAIQRHGSYDQTWAEKKGEGKRKEYDADIEGLFLTDRAGFNPNSIVDIMDFLKATERNDTMTTRIMRPLGTHPSSEFRRNKLANIIADRNVIIVNADKAYQAMTLPAESDLVEAISRARSIDDILKLPGQLHEKLALLAFIGTADFISSYGARYNIDANAVRSLFDEAAWRPYLRQYLAGRFPGLSEGQISLLYEVHFGFLFRRIEISAVRTLSSNLTGSELLEIYKIIARYPPVFSGSLYRETEEALKYSRQYMPGLRKIFYDTYGIVNEAITGTGLVSGSDVMTVTREAAKTFRYYYQAVLLDEEAYWKGLARYFDKAINDKDSLSSMIDIAIEVFGGEEDWLKNQFSSKMARYLITSNGYFMTLSPSAMLVAINTIMGGKSKAKNEVLDYFWKNIGDRVDQLTGAERMEFLNKMMQSIDLNNPTTDSPLFMDDTGAEIFYIGSGGINAVAQTKALYGTMAGLVTKELAGRKFSSVPEAVDVLISLVDKDVLIDYQDIIRIFGSFFQKANAEDYLRIADSIKKFVERNGFSAEDQGLNKTFGRAAVVHEVFLLAYFFKVQGVPFTFYRLDKKSELKTRDRTGRLEIDYSRYNEVPLFLEIIDDDGIENMTIEDILGKGLDRDGRKKAIFRPAVGDVGRDGNLNIFYDGTSFNYNAAVNNALRSHGFKTDTAHLKIIGDGFINKDAVDGWMAVLYPYAVFNGEDVLEVIGYLSYPPSGIKEPVVSGDVANNPMELARAVTREAGGAVNNSVADSREKDIGFRLWGDRKMRISSVAELEHAMAELDRYFPNDSKLKEKEMEKIFVAFLSAVAGIGYSTRSLRFRYNADGQAHDTHITDYQLGEGMARFKPNASQAERLVRGFETAYGHMSVSQRNEFAKLVYKILKNNGSLKYFSGAESDFGLVQTLFPFYSKAKDDIIYELLENYEDISQPMYLTAIKETTRFSYSDTSKDVQDAFAGVEGVKELIKNETRSERKKWLLWLISGKPEYKPERIKKQEGPARANADSMVRAFWTLTDSERLDLLDELLTNGDNALFKVDYASGNAGSAMAASSRPALMKKIAEENDLERNLGGLRDSLEAIYLGYGGRNFDWEVVRQWDDKVKGKYPFIDEERLKNAFFLICRAKEGLLARLGQKAGPQIEKMLAVMSAIDPNALSRSHGDARLIMLHSILGGYFLGEQSGKTREEVRNALIKNILKDMNYNYHPEDLELFVGRYYNGVKWEHEITEAEKKYISEMVPAIEGLVDSVLDDVMTIANVAEVTFSQNVDAGAAEEALNNRRAAAEAEADRVLASFNTSNPQFRKFQQLLAAYGVPVSDENVLGRYAEFEDFIDKLIDEKIAGLFQGDELEAVRGLIQIKFKRHSMERRVQFLNDLIKNMRDKASKGDMIVAFAESSGIAVVKLFQILAQQGLFKKLEADPRKGDELNARIGDLKSNADPIRKATIFAVLEKMGLMNAVLSVGKRLGAASIKQVHRVELSKPVKIGGRMTTRAALKVMRPAALKLLKEDFEILPYLVEFFSGLSPDSGISSDIIDTVRESLEEEIQFAKEVKAQQRFRDNLQRRRSPVYIPEVISPTMVELENGEQVLAILEEFIEGKALRDLPADRVPRGAYYTILNEVFAQIFTDGFFHADPHDGNIMIREDGSIVFIDVGAYGELDETKRGEVYAMLAAIVRGRANDFINSLKKLGIDTVFEKELVDVFKSADNIEKRLKGVFLVLSKHSQAMPQWLFMFFQATSKIGKYFDGLRVDQKARLFITHAPSVQRLVAIAERPLRSVKTFLRSSSSKTPMGSPTDISTPTTPSATGSGSWFAGRFYRLVAVVPETMAPLFILPLLFGFAAVPAWIAASVAILPAILFLAPHYKDGELKEHVKENKYTIWALTLGTYISGFFALSDPATGIVLISLLSTIHLAINTIDIYRRPALKVAPVATLLGAEEYLSSPNLVMHAFDPYRASRKYNSATGSYSFSKDNIVEDTILTDGIRIQVANVGAGYGADQTPEISVAYNVLKGWRENEAVGYGSIFNDDERLRGRVYILGTKQKLKKNLQGLGLQFDDRLGEGRINFADGRTGSLGASVIEGVIANIKDRNKEISRVKDSGLPIKIYLVDRVNGRPEIVEIIENANQKTPLAATLKSISPAPAAQITGPGAQAAAPAAQIAGPDARAVDRYALPYQKGVLGNVPSRMDMAAPIFKSSIELWRIWGSENRLNPEFALERLKYIDSLRQQGYLVFDGGEQSLNSAISNLWELVPETDRIRVKNAVLELAKNVDQHGGGFGYLIAKIEGGRLSIGVLNGDAGVAGFEVDESGKLKVMIPGGNRFYQRPDSPGVGRGMSIISENADGMAVLSRGQAWDRATGSVSEDDRIRNLDGALVVAEFNLTPAAETPSPVLSAPSGLSLTIRNMVYMLFAAGAALMSDPANGAQVPGELMNTTLASPEIAQLWERVPGIAAVIISAAYVFYLLLRFYMDGTVGKAMSLFRSKRQDIDLGADYNEMINGVEMKIARAMRFDRVPKQPDGGGYSYEGSFYPVTMWGSADRTLFIRFGDIFFMEEGAYKDLSGNNPGLADSIKNRVIIMDSNRRGAPSIKFQFGEHTALALVVMLHNAERIRSARVVDVGAGGGVLSMVALKLGARSVDMVDVDEYSMAKANSLMTVNGVEPERYRAHVADVRDTGGLAKILRDSARPEDESTVIISNIGQPYAEEAWEGYTATNLDSIKLASRLSRVSLVVAGSYQEIDGTNSSLRDRRAIADIAFKVGPEIRIRHLEPVVDGIGGERFGNYAWYAVPRALPLTPKAARIGVTFFTGALFMLLGVQLINLFTLSVMPFDPAISLVVAGVSIVGGTLALLYSIAKIFMRTEIGRDRPASLNSARNIAVGSMIAITILLNVFAFGKDAALRGGERRLASFVRNGSYSTISRESAIDSARELLSPYAYYIEDSAREYSLPPDLLSSILLANRIFKEREPTYGLQHGFGVLRSCFPKAGTSLDNMVSRLPGRIRNMGVEDRYADWLAAAAGASPTIGIGQVRSETVRDLQPWKRFGITVTDRSKEVWINSLLMKPALNIEATAAHLRHVIDLYAEKYPEFKGIEYNSAPANTEWLARLVASPWDSDGKLYTLNDIRSFREDMLNADWAIEGVSDALPKILQEIVIPAGTPGSGSWNPADRNWTRQAWWKETAISLAFGVFIISIMHLVGAHGLANIAGSIGAGLLFYMGHVDYAESFRAGGIRLVKGASSSWVPVFSLGKGLSLYSVLSGGVEGAVFGAALLTLTVILHYLVNLRYLTIRSSEFEGKHPRAKDGTFKKIYVPIRTKDGRFATPYQAAEETRSSMESAAFDEARIYSAQEAVTEFRRDFGRQSADALKFITKGRTDDLDDLESYEGRIIGARIERLVIRVAGEEYVFYIRQRSDRTPYEAAALSKSAAGGLAAKSYVIGSRDNPEKIIILPVAGTSLRNVRISADVVNDVGYGLGRLHGLGVVHNDLVSGSGMVNDHDHLYLLDRPNSVGVSVQFSDFSEATYNPNSSGIPEKREHDEVRAALQNAFLPEYSATAGKVFDAAYEQGRADAVVRGGLWFAGERYRANAPWIEAFTSLGFGAIVYGILSAAGLRDLAILIGAISASALFVSGHLRYSKGVGLYLAKQADLKTVIILTYLTIMPAVTLFAGYYYVAFAATLMLIGAHYYLNSAVSPTAVDINKALDGAIGPARPGSNIKFKKSLKQGEKGERLAWVDFSDRPSLSEAVFKPSLYSKLIQPIAFAGLAGEDQLKSEVMVESFTASDGRPAISITHGDRKMLDSRAYRTALAKVGRIMKRSRGEMNVDMMSGKVTLIFEPVTLEKYTEVMNSARPEEAKNLRDILRRGKDVVLEVGCGNAEASAAMARLHPERSVVAIDEFDIGSATDKYARTARQWDSGNLPAQNDPARPRDRLVIARADLKILHLIDDGSIDLIFLNHPDTLLLFQALDNIGLIMRKLKPGGRLVIKPHLEFGHHRNQGGSGYELLGTLTAREAMLKSGFAEPFTRQIGGENVTITLSNGNMLDGVDLDAASGWREAVKTDVVASFEKAPTMAPASIIKDALEEEGRDRIMNEQMSTLEPAVESVINSPEYQGPKFANIEPALAMPGYYNIKFMDIGHTFIRVPYDVSAKDLSDAISAHMAMLSTRGQYIGSIKRAVTAALSRNGVDTGKIAEREDQSDAVNNIADTVYSAQWTARRASGSILARQIQAALKDITFGEWPFLTQDFYLGIGDSRYWSGSFQATGNPNIVLSEGVVEVRYPAGRRPDIAQVPATPLEKAADNIRSRFGKDVHLQIAPRSFYAYRRAMVSADGRYNYSEAEMESVIRAAAESNDLVVVLDFNTGEDRIVDNITRGDDIRRDIEDYKPGEYKRKDDSVARIIRIDHHYDKKRLDSVSATPLVVEWLRSLHGKAADTGSAAEEARRLLKDLSQSSFSIVNHQDADIILSTSLIRNAASLEFLDKWGDLFAATALLQDHNIVPVSAEMSARAKRMSLVLSRLTETSERSDSPTFEQVLGYVEKVAEFALDTTPIDDIPASLVKQAYIEAAREKARDKEYIERRVASTARHEGEVFVLNADPEPGEARRSLYSGDVAALLSERNNGLLDGKSILLLVDTQEDGTTAFKLRRISQDAVASVNLIEVSRGLDKLFGTDGVFRGRRDASGGILKFNNARERAEAIKKIVEYINTIRVEAPTRVTSEYAPGPKRVTATGIVDAIEIVTPGAKYGARVIRGPGQKAVVTGRIEAPAATSAVVAMPSPAGKVDDEFIIDIGTGDGGVTEYLSRQYPRTSVVAVDEEPSGGLKARIDGLPNARLVSGRFEDWDSSGLAGKARGVYFLFPDVFGRTSLPDGAFDRFIQKVADLLRPESGEFIMAIEGGGWEDTVAALRSKGLDVRSEVVEMRNVASSVPIAGRSAQYQFTIKNGDDRMLQSPVTIIRAGKPLRPAGEAGPAFAPQASTVTSAGPALDADGQKIRNELIAYLRLYRNGVSGGIIDRSGDQLTILASRIQNAYRSKKSNGGIAPKLMLDDLAVAAEFDGNGANREKILMGMANSNAYSVRIMATGQDVDMPAPTFMEPEHRVAIEEQGLAGAAAMAAPDNRDAVIKVVSIVPDSAPDPSFNGLRRTLSKLGYGKGVSGQLADIKSSHLITIKDSQATAKNFIDAIGQSGVADASEGRVVAYVPQHILAEVQGHFQKVGADHVVIVPDSYRDRAYPDLIGRIAFARNLDFYMRTKSDNALAAIRSLLGKIAENGEGFLIVKDDGSIGFRGLLAIKAINYKDIDDWREMQEAIAQSA